MRVLILGGDGMLGHELFRALREEHTVRVTLRQPLSAYASFGLFGPQDAFDGVDVRSLARLTEVFSTFRPEAVVNCIGLVKQRDNTSDAIANLEINSLLPHRLAELCRIAEARLIHISTDCVFSGRKGNYTESDISDAEDLYGRSKYLGEVSGPGSLTLRTSIIGRELSRKRSLVEWFLAQEGCVRGYKQAIFSGFPTREFSRIIKTVIERFPERDGLYQVSAEPIDKFTLLHLLRNHFAKNIEIIPDDAVTIDRSLDSSRFRRDFEYMPPSWPELVAML